jgi:hypothetical protein
MSERIIDDVEYLMGVSSFKLDEILTDPKYNKANLRELVRRSLSVANEYKEAFEYERYEKEESSLHHQY